MTMKPKCPQAAQAKRDFELKKATYDTEVGHHFQLGINILTPTQHGCVVVVNEIILTDR